MKKTYIEPAVRTIDLMEESGILAGSDFKDGGVMNLNEGTVDEQMTDKKNLWGDEGIWK